MRKVVKIVILENESDYRKEYIENFVGSDIKFNLKRVPVIFSVEDFDHIFSEPGSEGTRRSFSKRRTRKMYFMKALLDDSIATELMLEERTGNIALFSRDLEAVMYLRIRPKTRSLQVRTFFDFGKDHTKMYNRKKKLCRLITEKELKEAVSSGPTTSKKCRQLY